MPSIFQGHRSPFNTILFLETRRPGTHRRVKFTTQNLERCISGLYVFLPFNKPCLTPLTYLLNNSVEMAGFEPATFALQRRCSPAELHPQDLLGLVWA